jgi:hypothetical protein
MRRVSPLDLGIEWEGRGGRDRRDRTELPESERQKPHH